MAIVNDFFSAARDKFDSAVEKFTTRPTSTQDSVGASIFEAIYQYGRGQFDAARERVANAILVSPQGAAVVQEVEKKRFMEYLPIIIGVAGLLIALGYISRR